MLQSVGEPSSQLDLGKALQDLYAERQRLEHVISVLQGLYQRGASAPVPPEPMGTVERKPVPERTKRCRTRQRPAN
jgi:hypothetical protein